MKNATYLGSLIENLLMLSKISRTTMETETVDISSISEELLKEEQQNNPNMNYQVEKNLSLQGDSGLIKILMKNLISNAVKYSSKSENPLIQFSAINGVNTTEFILKDNGVGFNSKFSDKLFKPFQRVHGDEYEGTGIGLSIVHRIIARHKGLIHISSEVGQGTIVKFSLS
jgi:signal transduction histidine kinase